MNADWTKEKILITGGTGLVGKALEAALLNIGCKYVSTIGNKDCDLRSFDTTMNGFTWLKPDYVFHLAAKVYGIGGNQAFKADSLYDNVAINTNVIECCRRIGVKKVVAMGSGCVYPVVNDGKDLTEDQIWLGPPHESEDSYAHAKRLMLAQLIANKQQYNMDYAFAISGNLYGEYDKFDEEYGHVVPALISKFYTAERNKMKAIVWGTGIAKRDFTYSGDIARALIYLMDCFDGPINIGSGNIHAIKEIIDILQELTGVSVIWDTTKPDGQSCRYYNLDKLKSLGFEPKVFLKEGIEKTYNWYKGQKENEC